MMKKSILVILSALLALSALLSGCQKQDNEGTAQTTPSTTEATLAATSQGETTQMQSATEQTTLQTTPSQTTASQTSAQQTDPPAVSLDEMTTEAIIQILAAEAGLGSDYMSAPMQSGDIGTVVGNFDFHPTFKEGTMMVPMIGSEPFVLAVLRLAPEQDAAAFASDMEKHAVLNKWVCVCADTAKALSREQTVVFFMCSQGRATTLERAFYQLCGQ